MQASNDCNYIVNDTGTRMGTAEDFICTVSDDRAWSMGLQVIAFALPTEFSGGRVRADPDVRCVLMFSRSILAALSKGGHTNVCWSFLTGCLERSRPD